MTSSSRMPPAARALAAAGAGGPGAGGGGGGGLADDLARQLVPRGNVVNEDHAGEGPAAEGTGVVGLDLFIVVAANGDGLGDHAFISHSKAPPKLPARRSTGNIPQQRAEAGKPRLRRGGAE